MTSFDNYLAPGKRGHLIGVGGVSMSPLAEVLAKEGYSPRIICESDGTMAEDALAMKNMYKAALSSL